jgi:hypothetical protein
MIIYELNNNYILVFTTLDHSNIMRFMQSKKDRLSMSLAILVSLDGAISNLDGDAVGK